MRFPPTNSPYLTGKTSSFHGNRMEGENKRETETEGRMDVRGVERGELTETGKWKTCLLFFFFHPQNAQEGSVTLAGGEVAPYQQRMWTTKRNVYLQHDGKSKRRASSLEVARVAGGYDPVAPGGSIWMLWKRVPQHLVNPIRNSLHQHTAGMMGIGKPTGQQRSLHRLRSFKSPIPMLTLNF